MKQPVVDSHVHFWQPNRLHYEWLADTPAINRPYLPADLLADTAGVDLQRAVFVQADCRPEEGLDEVAWVTELARNERRIGGIVAFAPLEVGAAARPWLDKLARNPLVKGVRRLIQSEPAGFCRQPNFVTGVRLLPQYHFSFDICCYHYQLEEVIELVASCPEVQFILDHLGKPDARQGLLEPWRGRLSQLAGFSNVLCKLSGLVTEADHQSWTRDGLRPYLDHALAAFGPDRLLFGGDWPVVRLAATYGRWLETLAWANRDLTAQERRQIFYQNALDFYGL